MKAINRIFTFILLTFALSSSQKSLGMLNSLVERTWRLPMQQEAQETTPPESIQRPQTHLDYLLQTTVPRIKWQTPHLNDDEKNALSIALHCDIARLANNNRSDESEITMPTLSNHINKTQEQAIQRALATQIEKYEREIQELNTRIEQKTQELNTLEETTRNNQNEMQKKQEPIISELKNTILKLRQELERAQQTINTQNIEAESAKTGMQNDIETGKNQISRLTSENQTLRSEVKKERNRYQLGLAVGMLAVGGLGGYLFAQYWK